MIPAVRGMLGSSAVEARYDHELQAVEVVDRRAMINRQAGQQHNSSHWKKKWRRALIFNYDAAGLSWTRVLMPRSSLWIQDDLLCQLRGCRSNYQECRDEQTGDCVQ